MARTGRPIKGTQKKDVSLQLRISKDTESKLKKCAETLGKSRTEIIEMGVNLIYESISVR